jgi:hypothetical protein
MMNSSSAIHSGQPGGGCGQDGSGSQPGGGDQPACGRGQFGGGLNFMNAPLGEQRQPDQDRETSSPADVDALYTVIGTAQQHER